jgi:uncharacterized membrane protein YfcA
MNLLLTLLLGAVIGLSLGALGGGGSILTVPALVYLLGEPAHAATTASLVIVGLTSIVGAVGHARSGNVRWLPGLVFGAVGIAASYAGTAVNRQVDPDVLLLAFAVMMLVAAGAMFRRSAHGPPVAPVDEQPYLTPGVAVKVVLAGSLVGFLTGFLGVGGGFIIVPALVMVLDFPMPAAVGTSLLVIAVNCGAALLARAGHQSFHWSVIVPFTVAAIVGSLAGTRVAGRVSGVTLTRAFAGLLVAVGLYTATRSLLTLV